MVWIKTKREIDLIRESSRIVAEVLRLIGSNVRPGVTTKELDELAEDFIRSADAEPAFKGYEGVAKTPFPATLCTSVDQEVVHGIPSSRRLREGEIISIDVGVRKNGYYGDAAMTFAVGQATAEKSRLMQVTREALAAGVREAVAGNFVQDISFAVQSCVEGGGFSVVRDLVGHGVGKELHEEPAVPNYGKPGMGTRLKNGMTLAIEPMVNMGSWRVKVAPDGWTVLTQDGLPSAHFEHTIAIVDGKPEILTQ